jgi:hypothetical protein
VPARLSPQAPGDSTFIEIVRGHLHFDTVARGEADPSLAHFAANSGEHHVLVVKFDPEHGSRQNQRDYTFDFDMSFFHLDWIRKRSALTRGLLQTAPETAKKCVRPAEPGHAMKEESIQ